MDRFEAFRESLGSMASFPSVTPALFEKFEAANRELLEKADLTPVQKAAISAELQNTPGAGVLEIIAHSLSNSPYVADLGIKLSDDLRRRLAEEADSMGEGEYSAELLLAFSDKVIAEAYLDAAKSYVEGI